MTEVLYASTVSIVAFIRSSLANVVPLQNNRSYVFFINHKGHYLQETLLSTRLQVRVRLCRTKAIRPAKLLTGISIGLISNAHVLTEGEVPTPGGRWTWKKTTKYIVSAFITATRVSNAICHPRVLYVLSQMLSQLSF